MRTDTIIISNDGSGMKEALIQAEKAAVFSADLAPMDKCFLYLLYGCGLRREEALALTIFDFDWKSKEVSIVKARALVNHLKEENKGNTEAVASLLKSTHPLVHKLSEVLGLDFGFWIDDVNMLKSFMTSQGWMLVESMDDSATEGVFVWQKGFTDITLLNISKTIFDEEQKLRDIKQTEWSDDFIKLIELPKNQTNQVSLPNLDSSDLPF